MKAKDCLNKLSNLQTPFYFYDMELLRLTLDIVNRESSRYGYKVHYAVKANFERPILEAVREAGLGTDCVSGNEVKASIESGFAPEDIVFAGVGKSDREIEYALEHGIFSFNCESRQELEVINNIAAQMNTVARVALRINPDVDPQTHQNISTGKADSKFGISYTEVDEVIARLGELANIELVGIHFHIGSQIRDLSVFENLCNRVNTIKGWFKEQGVVLKHINVGGGLGINYDDPDSELVPDFETYFAIFNKFLQLDADQTLHFELGRSVVAQCGELITKVLYNKKTADGTDVVIVDGSMTELIRPALYHAKHLIENLSEPCTKELHKYTVAGPVCESSDVFAKGIKLPATKRGDIITLRSAGAYGSAMSSRYNLRDLPQSVFSDKL